MIICLSSEQHQVLQKALNAFYGIRLPGNDRPPSRTDLVEFSPAPILSRTKQNSPTADHVWTLLDALSIVLENVHSDLTQQSRLELEALEKHETTSKQESAKVGQKLALEAYTRLVAAWEAMSRLASERETKVLVTKTPEENVAAANLAEWTELVSQWERRRAKIDEQQERPPRPSPLPVPISPERTSRFGWSQGDWDISPKHKPKTTTQET